MGFERHSKEKKNHRPFSIADLRGKIRWVNYFRFLAKKTTGTGQIKME